VLTNSVEKFLAASFGLPSASFIASLAPTYLPINRQGRRP